MKAISNLIRAGAKVNNNDDTPLYKAIFNQMARKDLFIDATTYLQCEQSKESIELFCPMGAHAGEDGTTHRARG